MQIDNPNSHQKLSLVSSLLFDIACLSGCLGMRSWHGFRWLEIAFWAMSLGLFIIVIWMVKKRGPSRNGLGQGGILGLSIPLTFMTFISKSIDRSIPFIYIGIGFCMACVLRSVLEIIDSYRQLPTAALKESSD